MTVAQFALWATLAVSIHAWGTDVLKNRVTPVLQVRPARDYTGDRLIAKGSFEITTLNPPIERE